MSLTIDLAGRRALVTGAGQGVGRAIALALAEAGASVVVNDLTRPRRRRLWAIRRRGRREAVGVAFDVTDHDAVVAGVEAAGPIDVLVNNAGNAGADGFGSRARFVDSEPADWEPFLRVNLYGVLHACRAVLPGMVEQGFGRIVTIVSDAGAAPATPAARSTGPRRRRPPA